MKYIFKQNKKEAAKLMIESFNKADIFDIKIPYLHFHNRILTKTKEPIKYYLNGKDLEEYQTNPTKVTNRIQKLEDGYTYEQKESIFETEVHFNDEINQYKTAKDIAKQVKEIILNRYKVINNNPYQYELKTYHEEGIGKTKNYYNDDGSIKYTIELFNEYYAIYMYCDIKQEEENTITKYYGSKKEIKITVKDNEESYWNLSDIKVKLKVILRDGIFIEINIERENV